MADEKQKTEVAASDEWVSAFDAVHRFFPVLKDDEAAKATILSRLQDGTLEGIADYVLQEADIGRLDFEGIGWGDYRLKRHANQYDKPFLRFASSEGTFTKVPVDFMLIAERWIIDPTVTCWSEGRILASRPARFVAPHAAIARPDLRTRRAVSGIMFKCSDLDAILGISGTTKATAQATRKRVGGRPRDRRWDDWVAELVAMTHEDGFDPATSGQEIIDTVSRKLAERGLDAPEEDSLRRTVSRVINRMEKAINP